MITTCPRCSTPLVPNDQGICPVCRRAVIPAVAESVVPSVIIRDASLPADGQVPLQPVVLTDSDAWYDASYRDACAILRGPEPSSSRSGLWLVVSLVAFVLAGQRNRPALELAIVVGVLFFHEAGHWLGMQIFGYRNVKMFFLPFFGAAVSGKKEGAPQWQEAIVLLLGPIPGLALGCALYFWHLMAPNQIVAEVSGWLVFINAFNLLPFEPLDGGRFLNLVIFSRHRVVESIFLTVTSLLVLSASLWRHVWIFAGLGAFGLCMVPARYRIARLASVIRQRWSNLPPRVADAPDEVLRDVYEQVKQSFSKRAAMKPANYAMTMRSVYERAVVRPVPLLGSFALLAAYGGGILLFWIWFVACMVAQFRAARPPA